MDAVLTQQCVHRSVFIQHQAAPAATQDIVEAEIDNGLTAAPCLSFLLPSLL